MPAPDNPASIDTVHDDESARIDIAVRALGDMRSRATTSISSESQAPAHSGKDEEKIEAQPTSATGSDFVSRMSSLPLLGTAIRVYEHGKASSRVVKYGAEMVESSVKTISKPVINRLPVNQIDEFACRQLDRLDRYRRPSSGPEPTSPRSPVSPSRAYPPASRLMDSEDVGDAGPPSPQVVQDVERGRPKLRTKTLDGSITFESSSHDRVVGLEQRRYSDRDKRVPKWIQDTRSSVSRSRTTSPIRTESDDFYPPQLSERPSGTSDHQTSHLRHRNSGHNQYLSHSQQIQNAGQNPERQVAQRSRWQAVLLEAGGLSAALSEENMRRLKYCLQWLQFATAHIDAQILILRDFIESIHPNPQTSSNRRPPLSEEHLRKLIEVRKDIVLTVRQMVDVVSKYAGGALPEPARSTVRGFILKLPQRWATRTAAAGVTGPSGTVPGVSHGTGVGGERETVAAAGSSTGVLRRGQGREKRAAQRERGTANSRTASPSPPDLHSVSNQPVSPSNAAAAAQRILSLATESLDMMRNVTGVVKDSLDRADAWVNRLRMVGVQRGTQDDAGDEVMNGEYGLPPLGSQHDLSGISRGDYRALFHRHRRGPSISSATGEDDASLFSNSTPASPFTTTTNLSLGAGYLSNSSYTASSSMPPTPTGGSFTTSAPPSISASASTRDLYGGMVASAPSPGAIPLASMHIASRYNTPKTGSTVLPSEDDDIESKSDERVTMGVGLAQMEIDS